MHDAAQFQEVLDDLKRAQPRVVVFEPAFAGSLLKSFPSTPVQALVPRDPVGDYILEHYRPCAALTAAQSWHFVFMVRNGLDCPKDPAWGGLARRAPEARAEEKIR